jgi:hypothetical protein
MSIFTQGKDLYFLYSFLKRLTTPFNETKAFELGIIDENGKVLRKRRTLSTQEEKDSYTLMDTMIFNMKKIMAKVPFGKSKLFSYAASLFLLKEQKTKYSYLINESKLEDDLLLFCDSLTEEEKNEIDLIIKSKGKSDLSKDEKQKEKEQEKDDEIKKSDDVLKSLSPEGPEEDPPSEDEGGEDTPPDDEDEDPVGKNKEDEDDEEDEEEDTEEEEYIINLKDDAPAVSTAGIAGAGDDSSTVPVSKKAQKKNRKSNITNIMKLRREASWKRITKK